MSTFENEAAWIVQEKARSLEVKTGPSPNPSEHEVVIKVAYAAVNPTDFKMQDAPYMSVPYPFIFGTDVAGTVAQVGSAVTRFRLGQRVIGHCDSLLTGKAANAGFQKYSTCREVLVCAVPDSIPLENAVVLPLSVDTAAAALFNNLDLPLPSMTPQRKEKTVLVWGGSSSVGSSVIQLAAAAGFKVIATASKSNAGYVKSLGAAEAFDYRDSKVRKRISDNLRPGDHVVDCISSPETLEACANLLSAVGGGTLPIMLWPVGSFPENVKVQLVNGLSPGFTKAELNGPWGTGAVHVGQAIWQDFMPTALSTGRFQAKPDPLVLKGGLAKVQEGIDLVRKGVSAQKIVIEVSA